VYNYVVPIRILEFEVEIISNIIHILIPKIYVFKYVDTLKITHFQLWENKERNNGK
jgi:hypothetical protein